MKNNFDPLAEVYDVLKKIWFGNTLDLASVRFVGEIPSDDELLIVGGGTGSILDKCSHVKCIDYVDQSAHMIRKARRRRDQGMRFYPVDFMEFLSERKYSKILLPFFLDVFDEKKLPEVIKKVKGHLKPGGSLLVSDFEDTGSSFQRALIRFMYYFFRKIANLEGRKLQPIHEILLQAGFIEKKVKFYRQGMIFSRLYQNSETL